SKARPSRGGGEAGPPASRPSLPGFRGLLTHALRAANSGCHIHARVLAGSEPDDGIEVLLAPLTILERDPIRIVDSHMGFGLATDPAFLVPAHQPSGDAVEIDLARAHLGPGLGAVP